MSVAKNQIQEIYDVFKLWIPNSGLRAALLVDLTKVKAYQSNKSFRETIDALLTVRNQERTNETKVK